MKARYLSLKGGLRYFLHTLGRIPPSSEVMPSKYNSYFLAQEIYEVVKTIHLPTAFIGIVVDGVYKGLLGTYEDYNGNRYTFSFDNGTFAATIDSKHGGLNSATYQGDCYIYFYSSIPSSTDPDDKGYLGIGIAHPFTNGAYTSTGSSLAVGFFNDEGRYNAYMGEFGGRPIINIGFVDGIFSWKASISDIQNFNIFGVIVPFSTMTGPTLRIGGETGQIEIDDSVTDEEEDEDPYNDDDESEGGGGDGDHDDSSDDIDFPDLPELSAVDTGFITLYNPSIAELRNLASYMWSSLFDLDSLRKLFANPMDAMLGLSMVPVNVPAGGSQAVKVGNISTGVNMTKAASQYVEVDCGYVDIKKYWGAYLDYDPYTKFEVYLPYIGTKNLSADDIMGKRVHIKYHVDVLSGACCAYIKCGTTILYNFSGQCSCEIPINGNDWSATIQAAISIGITAATLGATGAPASLTSGEAAAMGANISPLAMNKIDIAHKNTMRAYRGAIASSAGGAVSSAANVTKAEIHKSGGFGSMSGMLGIQKPYIIATRPRHCVPGNQNKYQGYPAFITRNLGGLRGYTEVDSIILDYVDASDVEIAEIVGLLQGGVIL